jgi:uncharacterized protein (TIGR03000 family)
LACAVLSGVASAQPAADAGIVFGHYPHGPRVAPPWGYPGLSGGPYVGYPPPGTPGYPAFGYPHGFFGDPSGRIGTARSHGLSLHHPPVPVYGPLPAVHGSDDLHRLWRSTLAPNLAGYGWCGIYAASPRPHPRTVSTWPVVTGPGAAAGAPVPGANVGGCLVLSVKVPQPAAEVLVDGKKTTQTGTDRIFESPPLEGGKGYEYTVTARWIERGQVVEMSKVVSGTPGEVVRVDFGTTAFGGR